MSTSDDDYFSDDWVLDDKTLAVLDEEESKFQRIASQQNANAQTRQSIGPPSKRHKTTPQPVNTRALHHADTLDDADDLPDVSVRQDGTYGLQDKQRRTSGPPSRLGIAPAPSQNVVARTASGARSTTAAPVSRGPVPQAAMRSAVNGPARVNHVPSRPPSAARSMRPAQSPVSSQEISRTQSGPPQRVNRVPSTATSGGFVDQLLKQIEELRKKNETMQADMESAIDAKFAKEGEVTILRKRMEKTAQEHLAQIAKLKVAKEEADAKQLQLHKQFEIDKERLKTELTFRRHELETSARKSSQVTVPKNDTSLQPLPTQRQRSGERSLAGPSRLAPETPRRPRFGIISDFEKPKRTAAPETRDLPSGFQTGPSRSQFGSGRRENQTASFDASQVPIVVPSTSPMAQKSNGRFFEPDVFGTPMDDVGPVQDYGPRVDVGADDVHMMDEGAPAMSLASQENTIVLPLPSRTLVFHDIMVTHTLRGSELPTLQLLVCSSPTEKSQVKSYGAALMRVFDTLGSIPAQPDRDFDDLARIVCCALCEITESLAKNDLIIPLTAVLNLLTKLAYMTPSMNPVLLRVSDHHETPHLLGVLHSIIDGQLQKLDVTAGNELPELCSLGKETLSLYEALVVCYPDDIQASLNKCSSTLSLLTALLDPHRPVWFLIESTWLLIWLSTRWCLFRSLLSHPANEPSRNDGERVDAPCHPQISLVCSLLTDTERQGPEADELKHCIIMFFCMLSNAHSDAHTLLVESQELIPSIVLYLFHLTTPIWHENGAVLSDPLAATRAIDIISHATLLLYHLVIGEDTTLDLHERLLRARAKTQEAPIHFFVLTFGRLSYANPPHWLDEKDRKRLTGVGDLARALLERVIQGPDLDLIWETYQYEGEETNEAHMDIDDEEVEAQKIANS